MYRINSDYNSCSVRLLQLRLDPETGERGWYCRYPNDKELCKHDKLHGRIGLNLETKWKIIEVAYNAMVRGRNFLYQVGEVCGVPDRITLYVLNQAVKYEELYNANSDENVLSYPLMEALAKAQTLQWKRMRELIISHLQKN